MLRSSCYYFCVVVTIVDGFFSRILYNGITIMYLSFEIIIVIKSFEYTNMLGCVQGQVTLSGQCLQNNRPGRYTHTHTHTHDWWLIDPGPGGPGVSNGL